MDGSRRDHAAGGQFRQLVDRRDGLIFAAAVMLGIADPNRAFGEAGVRPAGEDIGPREGAGLRNLDDRRVDGDRELRLFLDPRGVRIDEQAVAAAVQLFERIAHGVRVRPPGVEHVGRGNRVNGRSGLIEQEDRAVFLHFCGQIARLQHERKEIAGLRFVEQDRLFDRFAVERVCKVNAVVNVRVKQRRAELFRDKRVI